ncbi:MAG TPA: iron-containing alcohol dehydrogenase [Polyangiaceae bacterium]|nr:iron-containing alcohol dehydrogenase [Polyangiaceae bacterium]
MTAIWNYPTRVIFGVSESLRVGAVAKELGLKRLLLVSDRGVEHAGLLTPIRQALAKERIFVESFVDVSSNPLEEDVEKGAEAYNAARAQGLIAVGGGSPLDAAKLIAVRSQSSRPWEQLDDAKNGGQYIPPVLPPVIALPTTAGTGSEVGRAAVLTVKSTHRKTVVFSPLMLPKVAILDPLLTRSMPAWVTAATGFDALTHCLEAYLAVGDHPMADGIALAGLELIAANLPLAVATGTDLEARGAMMKAAMMGAAAFQKGLGACHSLAHPLSSECGLHHGLANALCLPAVIRFNQSAVPARVTRVAKIFSGGAAGDCAELLTALRQKIGLPSGLASAGVTEAQLPKLADLAVEDACHRENPRPCSREDFLDLYRASM